jgi:SRSO17 transposase
MRDDWEAAFAAGFDAYVDRLADVIGHADRVMPLKDYCTGLLVVEGRRSVEPLAAAVLKRVREMVLPAVERHGPIEAWIIDGER